VRRGVRHRCRCRRCSSGSATLLQQCVGTLGGAQGFDAHQGMFLSHLYGGMDEPEMKIIDVFICKLRKKLANASGGKDYIETAWARGYVMREPLEMRVSA
jgi:two-component system cell cycle response regulator CtrA